MKKLIIAIAAMLIAGSAFAQVGIIAGVTSSKTDIESAIADAKNISQYHVGLVGKIPLMGGLAIQPAVIYNIKGMTVGDAVSGGEAFKADFKTGFVEVPVQIQFGIDLEVVRPYIFVEPFVGYAVTNETKINVANVSDVSKDWDVIKNKLEYGFGAGIGVDIFKNLQVSARYFWNMGELYQDDASKVTSVSGGIATAVSAAQSQKCSGIMASLAIFF